jgi:hypothetical protein
LQGDRRRVPLDQAAAHLSNREQLTWTCLTGDGWILSLSGWLSVPVWCEHDAADRYAAERALTEGARLRQVRVVRDYGMYDRRENPQYYPDVGRP